MVLILGMFLNKKTKQNTVCWSKSRHYFQQVKLLSLSFGDCQSVFIFFLLTLSVTFIHSFTQWPVLPFPPPFIHPTDHISVFLNSFKASISTVAHVFCIPLSFRLADRSIRGWGPVPQAMVLASMFSLVHLIIHSPLLCTHTLYTILDVATQACGIFLLGWFLSREKPCGTFCLFFCKCEKTHWFHTKWDKLKPGGEL